MDTLLEKYADYGIGEFDQLPRVLQVSPDSGAARAGIHPDDIIIAIDGKTVRMARSLSL